MDVFHFITEIVQTLPLRQNPFASCYRKMRLVPYTSSYFHPAIFERLLFVSLCREGDMVYHDGNFGD
jgi:hypothetical protein